MTTISTIFVDGEKGGVGKSTVTRGIIHHYLGIAERDGKAIAIFDADRSNPDICGPGGITAGGSIIFAKTVDLTTEKGWIGFGNQLESVSKQAERLGADILAVVSMPAQIADAFSGDIGIVANMMQACNGIPAWVIGRTPDSVRALEYRVERMPEQYRRGLVVKNLFFGNRDEFRIWESSALRTKLLGNGWGECDYPELNELLVYRAERTPLHKVLREGIAGQSLGLGERLALSAWLNATDKVLGDGLTHVRGWSEA